MNTQVEPVFAIYKSARSSNNCHLKRRIPLKTYQVTNDEQRLKLINKVMGLQQLTIREV